MKWWVFVFAGFWSVIDTSCEVLWLTISVSSSPGCPHRPQDSVPHKSQSRRFSEFLLHKKAVKKIENKMCVKITLMTRSAYTQPTPVTRAQGRRRSTGIYWSRSQSLSEYLESKENSKVLMQLRLLRSVLRTFCTVIAVKIYTHLQFIQG